MSSENTWQTVDDVCKYLKVTNETLGYAPDRLWTEMIDSMKLQELQNGLSVTGLEGEIVASISAVIPITGTTLQVIYKLPDGSLKDYLIDESSVASIMKAEASRPWSFTGDAEQFKLAVEAKRIDFAFLFDPMMAVHTSNVDPLPHQLEISVLTTLVAQAKQVVASKMDRKWDELSKILQNFPEMKDSQGRHRKIIIFTEHRDTLNYLVEQIGNVLGNPGAIVTIHGGTNRDKRREIQALFRSDKDIRVLNLQNANLMVNYDLRWNPNRLEQHFGRIHRIGQQEVCHLWSLVAKETREGEAIRYSDRPNVRARLTQKIETAMDTERIKDLLSQNALSQETMTPDRRFSVREEMEKAEARRLQPFFIRAYFTKAFADLGGSMYPRESGRFEITHVPLAIRDTAPVLKRYERVSKGTTTITVSRNEILYAFNQDNLFVLAIVLINEDDTYEGPFYIQTPFENEPDWGVASVNYDLQSLLKKAVR